MDNLKKGQRVLYRRSVLCGRAPEFGIIRKRHKDEPNFSGWYVVVDEDRPESRGLSEHFSMLTLAGDDWREHEIARIRSEANEAMRLSNEDAVQRYKADALRDVADRLEAYVA